jgi:hypothetical protein
MKVETSAHEADCDGMGSVDKVSNKDGDDIVLFKGVETKIGLEKCGNYEVSIGEENTFWCTCQSLHIREDSCSY